MENPVDHKMDLGLVNYVKHPSNPNYIVYRFADTNRALSFEEELLKANIWFEKSIEERPQRTYTLYGIHKDSYKQTEKINFRVEAKHKNPIIPFKGFRYFVVLFGMALLILAIVGYCKNHDSASSQDESGALINVESQSE